jgi:putative acetyltransferase
VGSSRSRQGAGVATALFQRVEMAARAQGLSRIFTEASITACSFFERRGFRVVTPHVVEIRGQKLANFRMEKALSRDL